MGGELEARETHFVTHESQVSIKIIISGHLQDCQVFFNYTSTVISLSIYKYCIFNRELISFMEEKMKYMETINRDCRLKLKNLEEG